MYDHKVYNLEILVHQSFLIPICCATQHWRFAKLRKVHLDTDRSQAGFHFAYMPPLGTKIPGVKPCFQLNGDNSLFPTRQNNAKEWICIHSSKIVKQQNAKTYQKLRHLHTLAGNACRNKSININFFHNRGYAGMYYLVLADNGMLWSNNGIGERWNFFPNDFSE